METKLTMKAVATELRGLGMTITKRDGEYRVTLRGLGESNAYYTDDLADARRTAIDMALRHTERMMAVTKQLLAVRS